MAKKKRLAPAQRMRSIEDREAILQNIVMLDVSREKMGMAAEALKLAGMDRSGAYFEKFEKMLKQHVEKLLEKYDAPGPAGSQF